MTTEKKKRGRPPAEAPTMTGKIALRTLPEDMEQLAALTASAKLAGFDQPTIARAAFRLGLTLLELAPEMILAGVGPASKRRAALKPHFAREP